MDGPADFTAMAERAARLAQRALARGDARTADGWMRLYVKLRPFASNRREGTPPQRTPEPEPDRSAEVHLVHSVHPDSDAHPTTPIRRSLAPGAALTAAASRGLRSIRRRPQYARGQGRGLSCLPLSREAGEVRRRDSVGAEGPLGDSLSMLHLPPPSASRPPPRCAGEGKKDGQRAPAPLASQPSSSGPIPA